MGGAKSGPIKGAEMFYIFSKEIIRSLNQKIRDAMNLKIIVPQSNKFYDIYNFITAGNDGNFTED